MKIYLNKLELHGFKSFPEKTVIKFHHGITAVVGPNGCGKSNLVDALLWVLGEQRIKNLRGENNEDLIFNGSASKKPLGMTEVGAVITNTDEEVYIARRFFRNGESKYILNDKYCRNKDIQDELFKLDLGERKYFIFEQGSIDKLISLKPEEKRMLIEEAADISQYLERKKETANKLIIAAQNLDNIEILITDKKERLRELRNQVNYVERYRKIKDERTILLKSLLHQKYCFYRQQFDEINSQVEMLIGQETILVKEVTHNETQLLTHEEERWKADKQLKETQKTYYDCTRQILSAKAEIDKIMQQKHFNEQKMSELELEIKNAAADLADGEKQIHDARDHVSVLEKEIKNASSGGGETDTALIENRKVLSDLNQKQNQLKEEVFQTQSEGARLHNMIEDLNKKANRVENEVATKKQFTEELEKEIAALKVKDVETEGEKLNEDLQKRQDVAVKSEAERASIKSSLDNLYQERVRLENEISNLENQRSKYEEIKRKIRESQGLEEISPNTRRVQDLVRVEKKHVQIIENFYFDELDAVMVGGEDISSLDHNKLLLMRATVGDLPKGIDREPGFVASVKSLFTLNDETCKPYFRDGAVVENLKSALAIFGKYGVDAVTLDAEVITSHGLLIKNREKGILDVMTEMAEIEASLRTCRQKQDDVHRQLDEKKQICDTLTEQLASLTRAAERAKEAAVEWKARLDSLLNRREANQKRITLNRSEIGLLESNHDKYISELTSIREKHKKKRTAS